MSHAHHDSHHEVAHEKKQQNTPAPYEATWVTGLDSYKRRWPTLLSAVLVEFGGATAFYPRLTWSAVFQWGALGTRFVTSATYRLKVWWAVSQCGVL